MSKCRNIACVLWPLVLAQPKQTTNNGLPRVYYIHTRKGEAKPLVPSTEVAGEKGERIRKPRWTEEQEKRFDRLISPYLSDSVFGGKCKIDWEDIAQKFGDKSAATLRARFSVKRAQFDIRSSSGKGGNPTVSARWSVGEDDALRTAVAMYGEKSWELVSRFVGSRTAFQSIIRWRYLGMPLAGTKLPHLFWRSVLQRKNRLKHIDRSKAALGNMSRLSVIEAILNKEHEDDKRVVGGGGSDLPGFPLQGRVVREPFSVDEDNMIFRLVRLYGKKWVKITRLINIARKNKRVELLQSDGSGGAGSSKHVRARMVMEIYIQYNRLVSKVGGNPKNKKVGRTKGTALRQSRPWTELEDRELVGLVEEQMAHVDGFTSWKQISSKMKGRNRTSLQCMVRWTQYIGSHLKHTPFTVEEDEKLWPLAVRYYKLLQTKAEQSDEVHSVAGYMRMGDVRVVVEDGSVRMGLGWVGVELTPGRSHLNVYTRIRRFHRVMEWLRVVGRVQDPSMHFELVRGLANTPANFRTCPSPSANKANVLK